MSKETSRVTAYWAHSTFFFLEDTSYVKNKAKEWTSKGENKDKLARSAVAASSLWLDYSMSVRNRGELKLNKNYARLEASHLDSGETKSFKQHFIRDGYFLLLLDMFLLIMIPFIYLLPAVWWIGRGKMQHVVSLLGANCRVSL